jgi:hypothetical protein
VTKKGYRGVSVEVDIEKYLCAICGRDYEECPHFNVDLIPKGVTFGSPSLVHHPKLGTYLTDILAITTTKKHCHHRWIGYRSGAESRDQRILEQLASKNLSETAAKFILDFFRDRKSGECQYTERAPTV